MPKISENAELKNSDAEPTDVIIGAREVASEKEMESRGIGRLMTYMNVAWASGMPAAECIHLQKIAETSLYPEKVQLAEADLHAIPAGGKYKILKDAIVNDSIEKKVSYYSKLKRVIVSCDMVGGILDCRCCQRKRSCIHKAVCLWNLSSVNKLASLRVDFPVNKTDASESEESDRANDDMAANSSL
eukprot:gene3800-4325_t